MSPLCSLRHVSDMHKISMDHTRLSFSYLAQVQSTPAQLVISLLLDTFNISSIFCNSHHDIISHATNILNALRDNKWTSADIE